jgi:YD repeat-containing protein
VVYDEDGREVAEVNSLGNRKTNVYDTAGRVQATIDALGLRQVSAKVGLLACGRKCKKPPCFFSVLNEGSSPAAPNTEDFK